jgi:hypothetical protein
MPVISLIQNRFLQATAYPTTINITIRSSNMKEPVLSEAQIWEICKPHNINGKLRQRREQLEAELHDVKVAEALLKGNPDFSAAINALSIIRGIL